MSGMGGGAQSDMPSLTQVIGPLSQSVGQKGQDMVNALNKPGYGTNIADLYNTNVAMTVWSVNIQMTTAVVKEYSDALKGIVQKAN